MLLPGPGSRKAVAATLLLIFFTETFAPSLSYALTSGPTQPEATSFEPIDTTDMVNLQTGDFTYNVPMLEVPSPEGGFPMSLSYHAGIQTNMDASWVGLGWTLNPGAIDRNVNGYPDDWYAPTTTNHAYWAGGQTKTYTVGLSVGIANTPATVSFGLSFAHDTYRGFGVGVTEGVGMSFKIGDFGANVGVSWGINPYGGAYMSAGFGIGAGSGLNVSAGVGITTNFKSLEAGFSYGLGYNLGSRGNQSMGGTLIGSSISSDGGKPDTEIGGLTSSVSNRNANHVSTKSHGWHIDIPIYFGINLSLGYSKVRYWTDETTSVTTWGSLNNLGSGPSSGVGWDNAAYDEYSLLENPNYKNSVTYADPTTVQGGSFPDFDVYSVSAQGLGGNMRPYMFQGRLANQNIYNGSTPLVTYYLPGVTNSNPFFRFENDFSNSFRQNEAAYPDPTLNLRYVVPPLDASPVYGNNDGTAGYGYGSSLAGSKHVDIGPKIHPLNPLGYVKADKYQSYMIEGFSITNESGMTYHFGLPAYTYGEQSYQEKIDQSGGATGNRVTKPNPYAYTWYLTTITGPDFVDRNGDGIADDGDWGYWVDFEYGKWSNRYNWRNPSQGFQRDQDNQWQDVSMGTREVYYLNAIRTRTHVALFEKDIRNDAKGASPEIFNTVSSGSIASAGYANQGLYNVNSSQSLKLSHIYLLNASDENFVTAAMGNAAAYQPTANRPYGCTDCELASNVLDKTDVDAAGRFALEAKAIRVIDFNYDYSMCPNTANSFDINNASALLGKLTLLNFTDRGKAGANLTPPVSFTYDLTGSDVVSQAGVSLSPGSFFGGNGNFNVGDMVMMSGSPAVYCGIITAKVAAGVNWSYTLANSSYTGGTINATVYTTKNPPYNKDAYDNWGMFKGDYNLASIAFNENTGRLTTPSSAGAVDAWSLRTITSQLGGQTKVKYGSDQIARSVLNTNYAYMMAPGTIALDGAYNLLKFKINTFGYPISSIINPLDVGNIIIHTQFNCNQPPCDGEYATEFPVYKYSYTVNSIGADTVIHVTLSQPIPTSFTTQPSGGIEVFSRLITGNISAPNSMFYGGGIRVNSVTKTNSDNSQNIISYNYNDPNTGKSSGVTSFMPSVLDADDHSAYTWLDSYLQNIAEKLIYQPALNSDVNYLYSLGREVPAPAVIYQYVAVTNQIKNPDEAATRSAEGYTQYQFEVYNANMVGIVDITARTGPITTSWGSMNSRNLALMKFTGSVGNLQRMVQYDANGRKLGEIVNHYLHDNLANQTLSSFMTQYKALLAQYNYEGYLQERYYEIKEVTNQTNTADNGVKATLSAREEYPCIETGQTVINYVNGLQTNSVNLAFDFYSGAVTQTLETDAYGNNFITQTVPAYTKYPAMGLKINNDQNKNMLTQVAEVYRWKVDGSNAKLGLASANTTVWSDNVNALDINGGSNTENNPYLGDAWRTQASYNWQSTAQTADGTTPIAGFSDFNFANPSASDPGWKNTGTITLYDVYSKSLESKDINNVYTATHLTYGDQKVALTGSLANYNEIAFSGAEDAGVSQTSNLFVQAADGTIATGAGVAHTGAQSLQLGVSGKRGFLYSVPTSNLTAGRTYQASVWVKPTSGSTSTVGLYYDIDGTIKNSASSSTSTKTANGWTLVNLIINGSDITAAHTLNVYCRNDNTTIPAYVDDFRFQPQGSFVTAYVYDPFSGELAYTLDNADLYTHFVYDGVGRLTGTYKEKLSTGAYQVSQNQYNYGTAQFTNAAITNVYYYKNNCPVNYVGSGTSVSVPAATFNSFISQPDVDSRAQIYAQDYANTHGSCTCSPNFNWASGLSTITYSIGLTGTTVSFTFVFTWPSGGTTVNVGNMVGNCVFPTGTRTIPINGPSGSLFNAIVSPTGNVQLQLVSGSAPTGTIGFHGAYDLNLNSFYNVATSGFFTRNNCPVGQVGSNVTYTVAANAYSSTVSQAAANQLAQNDVNANGQNYANSVGTCSVACSFSWNSGFIMNSATISSSATTGSFNFSFAPSSGTLSSGTLGTITGGCKPSGTRFVTVNDTSHSGRQWQVTITSAGTVSVSLISGTGQTSSPPPAVISGTYAL